MARSNHNRSRGAQGSYEYWSKRKCKYLMPSIGKYGGRHVKTNTHRQERRLGKIQTRKDSET